MGVNVIQLTSKNYHENILASLQRLRTEGHLSDVTVQVDQQGFTQEFQAHKLMLAASSGYFKTVLLSPDVAQEKILLSTVHTDHFSKFLEFVYTGKVEVARDKIGDVLAAAECLDCEHLAEVCREAMSAGILQHPTKKISAPEEVDTHELHDGKKKKGTKRKKQQTQSLLPKQQQTPQSPETEVKAKRCKAKKTVSGEKLVKKLKVSLAGRKVVQRCLTRQRQNFNSENQVSTEDTDDGEDGAEAEAQPQYPAEKEEASILRMPSFDADVWECQDDGVQNEDPGDELMLSLGNEENQEEEQSKEIRKRSSKAQFHCKKCQRTFHYERSYLKHISTYHGVKADVVYRCETCQQTFANRSNLKIHEKHVHSTERLFSCDSCLKTFKRKKDVVRHQRQVHERNNLRHVCSKCGKALSSKTALVMHERTHTGAKPFECTDCGAKFTQNSALKMHRRIHTGEKPFACDECEARFTQKHMLIYHKRLHSGEKPFMCEACGKSFASKEYLRHHSNIHTGSRPYKCEQCGRCFAQRNSLHQHLKIHTGERPYSCKDCEKQFTQLNALQRHQRIHTGEKPYMCSLCSRTFTDKSTLRRHTMIHDSEAPWKTYLVVLEGNVENKKPQVSEKAATKAKKRKARAGVTATPAAADPSPEDRSEKTPSDSIVVPTEPVTLPAEWTTGAIAVVSHTAEGGITVIHTGMPAGTQIQPIMTTDSTGASVISLDGSAIPVPFSVSMAHPLPMSSEASTVSLPVSDSTAAAISEIPTHTTASILEAAASQTILAPDSESKAPCETDNLPSVIPAVVSGEKGYDKEQPAAGGQSTDDDASAEPKGAQDAE